MKKKYIKSVETIRRDNIKILARKYGITEKEVEELQKGPCDLCNTLISTGKAGRFSIDHSHDTNKVRGKLCQGCNLLIGSLEKLIRSELLEKAINYLSK